MSWPHLKPSHSLEVDLCELTSAGARDEPAVHVCFHTKFPANVM